MTTLADLLTTPTAEEVRATLPSDLLFRTILPHDEVVEEAERVRGGPAAAGRRRRPAQHRPAVEPRLRVVGVGMRREADEGREGAGRPFPDAAPAEAIGPAQAGHFPLGLAGQAPASVVNRALAGSTATAASSPLNADLIPPPSRLVPRLRVMAFASQQPLLRHRHWARVVASPSTCPTRHSPRRR